MVAGVGSTGQLGHALPDDIALDLVAAASNGATARSNCPLEPFAPVHSERFTTVKLRIGSQQFHREHLYAQVQLGARELERGAFGPGRLALKTSRHAPKGIVLDCL